MTALAVPHVVEQIGSYAGFAAVVGLAVLSALYISQARDLRRLREWAGRAPERAAEQATRGAVQPVPGRTVPPRPPAQAPKPAPGQAATAGAKPAAATAGAATAAAAGAQGAATPGGAAAQGAQPAAMPGAAEPPAPAKPGDGDSPAPDGDGQDAAEGTPPELAPVPAAGGGSDDAADEGAGNGSPPAAVTKPKPPPPPRPTPLPRRTASLPAPRPSQTAIPPRPGASAGRRWPEPRYIALAVVGVLVLAAAGAFGVPKLLEEDDSATAPRGAGREQSTQAAPVARDEITVSVLNGTTVPGLAAQVGDQVENEGFVLGNVTNASEQQRADSVVMYAPGHTRDARSVARRLRIGGGVEPVDADSQALAGDATVVVIVGQDQTR